MVDLESQLAPDHLARVVWAFVSDLDLSPLYERIGSRDGSAGRPAADPRVLLALWLYATLEGVGSARALEKLCAHHAAYRWLRGGVPVNYHGLSDFRTAAPELLDRLLTQSVTALTSSGLVALSEVAVDGTKVEASAGRHSFRDGAGLARHEAAAAERVRLLRAELESDPGQGDRRRRAAQARAEADVAERAGRARKALEALRAEKAKREKSHKAAEARKKSVKASSTDPDARIMKMATGGFRPAYNLILATAPRAQIILSVMPSDRRDDAGHVLPIVADLERRYGQRPARLLADTRLGVQDEIAALAEHDPPTMVYSPPQPDKPDAKPASVRKRAARRAQEPEPIKQWRARMDSEAGKQVYARRRLIEAVNGQIKGMGLRKLRLRSLIKVRCEALFYAIAHNIKRGDVLRRAVPA
jgi:transposase